MYSLKQWLFYLVILVFAAIGLNHTVHSATSIPTQRQLLQTQKYVVKIVCDTGSGSGVFYNGKVLTALHVVQGAISCASVDLDGNSIMLELDSYNIGADLALLRSEIKFKTKGVKLAKMKKQKLYDPIYTIAFPNGSYYFMTQGHYQGSYKEFFSMSSMFVLFGSSGGGVFTIENKQIRLVGIIHSIAIVRNQFVSEMSHYTDLETIREFLR